ncbi:hypothetical protein GXW78_26055 [Roseomonas terrae]|uniref:Uncharacterized protein n=1 Tax=Neoroseomonas terrae TaxID=424799 RepID=A0ABS5EQ32_9PROT|nr:hypothetical protein [Neoroseomonas terrae]MBR0653147.1 hypothetical protein [Neoroseomonas terrae]
MLNRVMEVLRVGPDRRLYQVSLGENYGLVEMVSDGSIPLPDDRDRALGSPDVQAFLEGWLMTDGVLLGSAHPPHLRWDDLCRFVPRACNV